VAGHQQFYELDRTVAYADPLIVTRYACEDIANPKHREQVEGLIKRLQEEAVSAANVQEMLRLVARQRVQDKLAHALASRSPKDEVERSLTSGGPSQCRWIRTPRR